MRSLAFMGLVSSFVLSSAFAGNTVGVFSCHTFDKMLADYPDATTYLDYTHLDREKSINRVIKSLAQRTQEMSKANRTLSIQLALEIHETNLKGFITNIQDPNSVVSQNIVKLTQALNQETSTVYLRPFSEMNDEDVSTAGWKLGRDPSANSPEDLAEAWKLLREAFRNAGLKNAEFHFNVLAALNVGREPTDPGNLEFTFKALELIPITDVDRLGFNIYARPAGAPWVAHMDTTQNWLLQEDYIPATQLVQPWMDRLKKSPTHSSLQQVVGEMGVSNQGQDEKKALWIRQTFELARKEKFTMATYFDCLPGNWAASSKFSVITLQDQLKLGL